MVDIFISFERIFTVFSLIIYSGGFLSLALSGGASEGDLGVVQQADSSAVLLAYKLIYIITFILLVLRWKKVFLILKKDIFITSVILFSVASILWSFDPQTTFVRCIALVGTSLFGLYFATRYSLEEQLKNLVLAFSLVIFFSFITAIFLPKYGIMSGLHSGAWRGIYLHKNVLGKMMALSSSIFLIEVNCKQSKAIDYLGLGLSIILLLFSKSSSAIGTVIFIFAIFLILRIFRWRYQVMVPALFAILIIGMSGILLFTEHMDTILISAGKDPTFTGRTDLWLWALDDIWERPWLGYGYGAFWQDSSSKAALIRYASGWNIPNAHNGLLDLWLDLGLLGVFLVMLGIIRTAFQAFHLLRNTASTTFIWPFLFVSNTVFANLTETTLMVRNDLFWVLFVATAFSVLTYSEIDRNTPKLNNVLT